jgi:two-component sensor histidine kinase
MFDLGDLTEQVLKSLRPGLGKQNLTLNVECERDFTMNSYPGPYGQVLTNLFLNSVTHAFPDGQAGTIDIKVQATADDAVEVFFCDDCCGMSFNEEAPSVNSFAAAAWSVARRVIFVKGLYSHIPIERLITPKYVTKSK